MPLSTPRNPPLQYFRGTPPSSNIQYNLVNTFGFEEKQTEISQNFKDLLSTLQKISKASKYQSHIYLFEKRMKGKVWKAKSKFT